MNAAGPGLGQPVEEAPTLQMVDINGQSVASVRFDRDGDFVSGAGDPNTPGSGSVDRLFQTNNLDPDFDPLNIGNGSDLTAIVVFNPDFTTTPAFGFEPVIAKRGTTSSVWQLGINNTDGPRGGRLNYVTFDATTEYVSGSSIDEKVWHVSALTVVDDPASPADTIDFWDDTSMDAALRMTSLGSVPTDTTSNRNATTAEPFAIGAHSQACCGEGESFAGNIAEIIIMSKLLAPEDSEWQSIESYLINKYFESDALLGDFNLDGQLDAADLDLMAARLDPNDPTFDLNDDGLVDFADRVVWVHDLKNTYIGDSDLNGVFDSDDFVTVFIAGKYEIDEVAGWAEGDWDGDLRFTSLDFVAAFIDGGYERGPRAAVAAVPEPSSLVLLYIVGCWSVPSEGSENSS